MLRKDKSNNQVCNISKYPILKLFGLTVNFFVLFNEGNQFFFHDIWNSFVCIADCKSRRISKSILFQIFPVFLNNGSFALYISTMFEEKV